MYLACKCSVLGIHGISGLSRSYPHGCTLECTHHSSLIHTHATLPGQFTPTTTYEYQNHFILFFLSGCPTFTLAIISLISPISRFISCSDGDQFYFFISGVAALTLLINGTLASHFITYLGLSPDPAKPKSPELRYVLKQVSPPGCACVSACIRCACVSAQAG